MLAEGVDGNVVELAVFQYESHESGVGGECRGEVLDVDMAQRDVGEIQDEDVVVDLERLRCRGDDRQRYGAVDRGMAAGLLQRQRWEGGGARSSVAVAVAVAHGGCRSGCSNCAIDGGSCSGGGGFDSIRSGSGCRAAIRRPTNAPHPRPAGRGHGERPRILAVASPLSEGVVGVSGRCPPVGGSRHIRASLPYKTLGLIQREAVGLDAVAAVDQIAALAVGDGERLPLVLLEELEEAPTRAGRRTQRAQPPLLAVLLELLSGKLRGCGGRGRRLLVAGCEGEALLLLFLLLLPLVAGVGRHGGGRRRRGGVAAVVVGVVVGDGGAWHAVAVAMAVLVVVVVAASAHLHGLRRAEGDAGPRHGVCVCMDCRSASLCAYAFVYADADACQRCAECMQQGSFRQSLDLLSRNDCGSCLSRRIEESATSQSKC
mmetsp:Transcript_5074/g.14825  ORF Transcript_5074/g.14825 Transcript_5074/m.14825 type:complete len:430 (+) Transcript_5074:3241-4530(+)